MKEEDRMGVGRIYERKGEEGTRMRSNKEVDREGGMTERDNEEIKENKIIKPGVTEKTAINALRKEQQNIQKGKTEN